MSGVQRMIEEVRARFGPKAAITERVDVEPWLTDWRGRFHGEAAAILAPSSTEEVVEIVRLAAEHRVPLVPQGGNTSMVGKRKVRRLPDILAEIDAFFAIARSEGVHGSGVHLEMSALDVTECIGGRGPASIDELDKNWLTACDPRLNRSQAVDLAGHVAALIG